MRTRCIITFLGGSQKEKKKGKVQKTPVKQVRRNLFIESKESDENNSTARAPRKRKLSQGEKKKHAKRRFQRRNTVGMYSNHAIIDPYLTIPGRQPRNQNHASNGEVLPALNTCLCGEKEVTIWKKLQNSCNSPQQRITRVFLFILNCFFSYGWIGKRASPATPLTWSQGAWSARSIPNKFDIEVRAKFLEINGGAYLFVWQVLFQAPRFRRLLPINRSLMHYGTSRIEPGQLL